MRVVCSIPGRLRVHLDFIRRNQRLAIGLDSYLRGIAGISTVSVNQITGNVLVLYRQEAIKEAEIIGAIKSLTAKEQVFFLQKYDVPAGKSISGIFLAAFNPLYLWKNRHLQKVARLAERIVKVGFLVIATRVIGLKLNLSSSIAILILSNPGVLVAISLMTWYYAAIRAQTKNIFVMDSLALEQLEQPKIIFLESGLLLPEDKSAENTNKKFNKNTIQELVALKQLENPVQPQIKDLVEGVRNQGVIDLAVISQTKSSLIEFAGDYLGIKNVYSFDDKRLAMINRVKVSKQDMHATVFMTTAAGLNNMGYLKPDLIVCVERNGEVCAEQGDIILSHDNLVGFPDLLKLSKSCEQLIIQYQSMAVTVNLAAVFFSTLGYLNPVRAITVYLLNMLFAQLMIEKKIMTI
jgi:cation transport ATPase